MRLVQAATAQSCRTPRDQKSPALRRKSLATGVSLMSNRGTRGECSKGNQSATQRKWRMQYGPMDEMTMGMETVPRLWPPYPNRPNPRVGARTMHQPSQNPNPRVSRSAYSKWVAGAVWREIVQIIESMEVCLFYI